jgi:hypothetical protein
MKCPICGYNVDDNPNKRSIDQLRRYFAVIRAVHFFWPETHEEQFDNPEDLRKYLQMKAGHREIGARIDLNGLPKEQALMIAEAAIRATGSYAAPRIHNNVLVVFRPKSIAFHKMSHTAFCELNNQVHEVIIAESGLDPDSVLKEYERQV